MTHTITRRQFSGRNDGSLGWSPVRGESGEAVMGRRRFRERVPPSGLLYRHHARTEWETPLALEKATHAINGTNPDLVIAGGDLITDGFQSSAASVEPAGRLI